MEKRCKNCIKYFEDAQEGKNYFIVRGYCQMYNSRTMRLEYKKVGREEYCKCFEPRSYF